MTDVYTNIRLAGVEEIITICIHTFIHTYIHTYTQYTRTYTPDTQNAVNGDDYHDNDECVRHGH